MGIKNFFSKQGTKITDKTKKVVNADELNVHKGFIKEMIDVVKKPISDENNNIETFDIAKQRLGLKTEDVKKVYSNYYMIFMVTGGFFLLTFLFAIMYLFTGKIIGAFGTIGIMAICFSKVFEASFRMYQIRHGELLPVQSFILDKTEWFPTPLKVVTSKPKSNATKIQQIKKPPQFIEETKEIVQNEEQELNTKAPEIPEIAIKKPTATETLKSKYKKY